MSAEEVKTDSGDEKDIEGGKQCRICYDGDYRSSPLISPCMCNGDIKYVHRDCLDQYRIMNEGMIAFTQCNTCQFEYIFELIGNEKGCKSPKCLLRTRVLRDVSLTIFLWIFIIALFGVFVHQFFVTDWLVSFVYGSIALFALIGIFCLIYGLFYMCSADSGNVYCWGCYCTPINGDCVGGDCNADDDGCGAVLLIIAIILAVIGLIYASIFTFAVLSTKITKHYQRYHKSLLSRYIRYLGDIHVRNLYVHVCIFIFIFREYVVMNLDGYSNRKIERIQRQQQKSAAGLMVINNNETINAPASVKSPSKKKGNDLYVLLDPNSVSINAENVSNNVKTSIDIESGQTTIKDDIIPNNRV